eukprot:CAMPEP_0114979172 /NCGR_PEP_ID=MMETSP0216-20121206/4219_1 /TAXON_ID=223996 /ORGANISM="Protocruzia adherens, Strain Boccale" /LENGTH=501 /DNA_ID=CAMNT_0002340459 /DNA_START=141 /DNA_END=1646 /DNA_ORIENTATION=-
MKDTVAPMSKNVIPNAQDKDATAKHRDQFLGKVFTMMKDYLNETTTGEAKVVDFKLPHELEEMIDFQIYRENTEDDTLLETCQQVLDYSVRSNHPRFHNQLYGGCDTYSLAGDYLSTTTNGAMFTYEMTPVFSVMETHFINFLGQTLGWEKVDGIFAPGGSFANFYGVMIARYHKFPQVKEDGMHGLPPLCVLTSSQSHYSITKAAVMMGIGSSNVIKVDCDDQGRMKPEALEAAIQDCMSMGLTPFMVNATVATTVVGAIDPLDEIAEICEKYDIWMHVDACLGGPSFMSRSKKEEISGVLRADSVAWDFHKLFTIPQQSAVFLTRHEDVLFNCNSYGAKYLFQQDKVNYDVSLDTGDKSVQCTRHVDIFKTWMLFKGKGMQTIEDEIERSLDNAKYLGELCNEHENFELLYDVQFIQVCFYYIPPSMQGQERTEEWWEKLDTVSATIKGRMVEQGTTMVGYQQHAEHVNFFRMTVSNPCSRREDMEWVISEIERLGCDL